MASMSHDAATRYHPEVLDEPWGVQEQWQAVGGVPLAMHYVTGLLRSDDGRSWMAMRSTFPVAARKLTLLERRAEESYHAVPNIDPYAGAVEYGCRDGVWGDWQPDGSALIESTDGALGWHESGLLDVSGDLLGTPPRCAVVESDVPIVYSMRWFAVDGKVTGVPVSGTAVLASVHLPGGYQLTSSPYIAEAQIAWAEFCNEFDDGTCESGLLVAGRQGFSVLAVGRSDGSASTSTSVSLTVVTGSGVPDFPEFARFDTDRGVWEARPLRAEGRWPIRSDLPGGHRLVEARIGRVGEQRSVRRSSGWLETYQERL